jgi:hypothetical protein
MKMAEKFGIPVLSFIDTPGAYPGIEAEERGQGEAIARNLLEMARLQVPIMVFIIGEGASGGALGIGVGDRVMMLENSWYSVISPESCSSILWRSWEYKEKAADALKLTAKDMKKMTLIDEIIKEPMGGAHSDSELMFQIVKKKIEKTYEELAELPVKTLLKERMEKYSEHGSLSRIAKAMTEPNRVQRIATKNAEVISLERGKIPPQAVELERVVLGAMLIDKKGVDEVIDMLQRRGLLCRCASKDIFSNSRALSRDQTHRLVNGV